MVVRKISHRCFLAARNWEQNQLLRSGSFGDQGAYWGEGAVEVDRLCWQQAVNTVDEYGGATPLLGEEDEHRGKDEIRGRWVQKILDQNRPFFLVDPLDGTNQLVAMGERTGWAACALLVDGDRFKCSVRLGDGREVFSDGEGVFLRSDDGLEVPLRAKDKHEGFSRGHWVIPAARRQQILNVTKMLEKNPDIHWINPLAGTAGLLASLGFASADGALASKSYAWDLMGVLLLAEAGFPVLNRDGKLLSGTDVLAVMKDALIQGKRADDLIVGRTIDCAEELLASLA